MYVDDPTAALKLRWLLLQRMSLAESLFALSCKKACSLSMSGISNCNEGRDMRPEVKRH